MNHKTIGLKSWKEPVLPNALQCRNHLLPSLPGPLDTDMQEEARTRSGNLELRKTFLHMKEHGELLDCDISSQKLLDLLLANTFESGAHVDFYDI